MNGGETEEEKFVSPLYFAVSECMPPAREEVENVAVPLVKGKLLEMALDPSKTVTVPVAELGATEI